MKRRKARAGRAKARERKALAKLLVEKTESLLLLKRMQEEAEKSNSLFVLKRAQREKQAKEVREVLAFPSICGLTWEAISWSGIMPGPLEIFFWVIEKL